MNTNESMSNPFLGKLLAGTGIHLRRISKQPVAHDNLQMLQIRRELNQLLADLDAPREQPVETNTAKNKVKLMHKLGVSIPEISTSLCIPFAEVDLMIRANELRRGL